MCFHLGSKRDCPDCKGRISMESFMISGDEVYFECKQCGCKLFEDRETDNWIINVYKHGMMNK